MFGFNPTLRDSTLLLLILIFAADQGLAYAQKAAKSKRKLIMREPIFDDSLVPKPKPFKLQIKRTQYLLPADTEVLLHGEKKIVELSATKTDEALKAGVAESQTNTTILTREYGIKPFSVNLTAMTPKFAPDITRMMEAQAKEARRKLAGEVEQQRRLMNQELKARKPFLDSAPQLPPNKGSVSSQPLEAAIAKAQEEARKKPPLTAQVSEKPLVASVPKEETPKFPNLLDFLQPKKNQQPATPATPVTGIKRPPVTSAPLKMPEIPKQTITASIPIPSTIQATGVPIIPATTTTDAQRKMQEELVAARRKLPTDSSDLSGKLMQAKTQAQLTAQRAEPAMNAILTRLHTDAKLSIPKDSNTSATTDVDAQIAIQWDKWHANFADLARQPILDYMTSQGNPCGKNTVSITVRANHKIEVALLSHSNKEFDAALTQAYQSLDGNAGLQFPAGSKRTSVSFSIDNEHSVAGIPSKVQSQTTTGDTETVRFHR